MPRKHGGQDAHDDAQDDPDETPLRARARSSPVRPPSTCGTTFAPRFTNDVRSREMKSFFIISPYWTGMRLVEAEVLAHRRERLLVRVAPGDAGRRVDAGSREEDQEDEDADREHDEHRRDEPAGDEARASAAGPVLGARVERVTDAVAENVQREHRDRDRDAGSDRDQRSGVEQPLAVQDDRPPARFRAAERRSRGTTARPRSASRAR